jgi:CRISPR/Cas system endoribonuclease Cas6 (RAMP superfamily)
VLCVTPSLQLLMNSCVYHGTCSYLSGVLHKFVPQSVFIPSIVATQRLSKNVNAATNALNRGIDGRRLYSVRVVARKGRGLVLPRTSCFCIW